MKLSLQQVRSQPESVRANRDSPSTAIAILALYRGLTSVSRAVVGSTDAWPVALSLSSFPLPSFGRQRRGIPPLRFVLSCLGTLTWFRLLRRHSPPPTSSLMPQDSWLSPPATALLAAVESISVVVLSSSYSPDRSSFALGC